jgi:hypothetical protein
LSLARWPSRCVSRVLLPRLYASALNCVVSRACPPPTVQWAGKLVPGSIGRSKSIAAVRFPIAIVVVDLISVLPVHVPLHDGVSIVGG